jgi:hypothetical protein
MRDDGTPFFATDYLIRKELRMTEEEIESNQQWFDSKEEEEEATVAGTPGAPPAPGGAAPAAPAPAAAGEGGSETVEGGETKGTGQL